MNITTVSICLPLLGAVYGGFLGAYIRSKNKTPKKKLTLVISGILLLLTCITVIVTAFT